jgi:hypothetical protein
MRDGGLVGSGLKGQISHDSITVRLAKCRHRDQEAGEHCVTRAIMATPSD